jgi:hypothetical protein
MTIPKITIHDLLTNKVTLRDLNEKELSEFNSQLLQEEAEKQAKAEKQALKDSANAKLAALGLTPEEIAAITGAN